MPELPDVEVFRRYLNATALHQRIEEVEVLSSKVLEGVSAGRLEKELRGTLLDSTRRHGKYLFVYRATPAEKSKLPLLVLHFGMTGYLKYFKDPEDEGSEPEGPEETRPDLARKLRHERLAFHFDNGYHLAYVSQRLLGSVHLVDDPDRFLEKKELGPDALELRFQELAGILGRGRGSVKSTLMNQKLLAGIGNIYSDEILFQARLHPKAEVRGLDGDALRKLHGKLRHVLETAIEAGADPDEMPRSWLLPHREEGKSCPRCSGKIRKAQVSGRSAYFCPDCQKGGPS